MDVKQVRQRLKNIRKAASDAEVAHAEEDALYFEIIRAIASNTCDNPQACCKLALKTKAIPFGRYTS